MRLNVFESEEWGYFNICEKDTAAMTISRHQGALLEEAAEHLECLVRLVYDLNEGTTNNGYIYNSKR